MPGRMFSSVTGLCSPAAGENPPSKAVRMTHASRRCGMSPAGQESPWPRTTALEGGPDRREVREKKRVAPSRIWPPFKFELRSEPLSLSPLPLSCFLRALCSGPAQGPDAPRGSSCSVRSRARGSGMGEARSRACHLAESAVTRQACTSALPQAPSLCGTQGPGDTQLSLGQPAARRGRRAVFRTPRSLPRWGEKPARDTVQCRG